MNIQSIFENVIRTCLWWLMNFVFSFMDNIYKICKALGTFNLFSGNYYKGEGTMWTYYTYFIAAFLTFFIIYRVVKMLVLAFVDEERMIQLNPMKIIYRIAIIGIVVGIAPYFLQQVGIMVAGLINGIENFLGVKATNLSDMYCAVGGAKNCKEIVDINVLNGRNYRYFADMTDFLMVVVGGTAAGVLMFLCAIDIAKRFIGMILKLVLSPWVFSSIVEDKAENFNTWVQLFIADFMANFLQILLIVIGTTVVINFDFVGGNEELKGLQTLIKVIAMAGSLIGVLMAPSGVGQLIGADIGMTSAMQGMHSLKATGMGLKAGLGVAGGGILGGIGLLRKGYQGSVYFGGRAVGGISKKDAINQLLSGGSSNQSSSGSSHEGGNFVSDNSGIYETSLGNENPNFYRQNILSQNPKRKKSLARKLGAAGNKNRIAASINWGVSKMYQTEVNRRIRKDLGRNAPQLKTKSFKERMEPFKKEKNTSTKNSSGKSFEV